MILLGTHKALALSFYKNNSGKSVKLKKTVILTAILLCPKYTIESTLCQLSIVMNKEHPRRVLFYMLYLKKNRFSFFENSIISETAGF